MKTLKELCGVSAILFVICSAEWIADVFFKITAEVII